ncbi:glycosyltransferase 61 family protein [Commensalibacter papalotli (ex Servin-Garciduenas et al. 2014)]|uniref:Glycosyltransferase 61 catalytic domain-containing protein n=1 Tax=Commensalibacter papalotli (ex Servin-Garciduenas et al. 2014) TaxID=1208583 RepID=W7DPB1_9PROT|nr:glycosyltransferase family 61 protein [Commensalibacter papalotli (ex Servin-Garciduenas et al. 2014)]EUK19182.1 hypothetical protein COMX_05510 [Commensalibacter papalotli (ex Servin-Garciduenas et al. 2014)]
MKIKGQYSTFSFRPPGVLKSSVSTSPRPRLKPVETMPNQQMTRLAQGIDPKSEKPLDSLNEIPAGMLFFCNLENVYFIVQDKTDGIIVTDDFHVITESMYYCQDPQFLSKELPDLQDVELLDEVFLAFDAQWMRYNHWMGYCLSKAYLANQYTPKHMKIVIPEYRENTSIPNPISKEVYDKSLIETGLEQRVTKLKNGIYKAKKLSYFWPNNYLPHSYFNFNDAKASFSHLNKNIKYNKDLPARFFINQDQNMMPILEDKDTALIQQALKDLDIPSVDLSTMDWDSQISLFSQAELIISPHRPELINLLFCQNDTEIIEFTRSLNRTNYLPAWPYLIASSNRLQYSFFDLDWVTLNVDMIKNAVSKLDSI